MNFGDLLGSVMQGGMSASSTNRIRSSLGGLGGSLGGSLGGGALGNILGEAGRLVGGNQNLAIGGLGALAGALVGGRGRRLGGALGGGAMALLGAMAFQALKARTGQAPSVPLGLATPQSKAEEAELERNSGLVLRAMVNAAKADGRIDEDEISRILGKVREMGVEAEAQEFLRAEMAKPMETASLISAARDKPELAAQLYAASLLAIEVDTPAEEQYLQQLAEGLGLEPAVTERLHQAVGLQKG